MNKQHRDVKMSLIKGTVSEISCQSDLSAKILNKCPFPFASYQSTPNKDLSGDAMCLYVCVRTKVKC